MRDRSADEAEILELLNKKRIAIWMRDFDSWSECFVHEPYLTRWGWWRQGGIFNRRGWEEISGRLRREFTKYPDPNPRFAYETKIQNLHIRIVGDLAWATFDQQYPGGEMYGQRPGPGLTHELCVLERQEGRWRIAVLAFLDTASGRARELIRLDADSRIVWMNPAGKAALDAEDDLVVRNGRLHIRDSRIDKKLQAAVRWAARVDSDFMPRQAAVPIVMEAIEDMPTRVWWVLCNAGMVHFSFGDRRLTTERLEIATLIYGLSRAQRQIAELVAEGLSLNEIASRMKITPNTARTHLERVYDKVGVRTQPALVRVLLSAVAPL
jgi:DNA-binding CsgD family transcriptional regulator